MGVSFNTIFYANVIPFIISLIFIWLVYYNPIFNKKQEKLFLAAGCVNIIMLVVISINYIASKQIDGVSIYFVSTIRKYTTFLNFAVSPIVPLLLYKINFISDNSKKIFIPLVINILLCIISLFNGMIFSVDSLNLYGRGNLFFLPFLTSIFYIMCLIIHANNNHLKGKRYEKIFLIFTISLLMFGMYLEIGLHLLFMTWVCASLILPLYYLLLNINHTILDPLTGAFNRLIYNKELNKIDKKKTCVIAMCDIDNFKAVNDTLGHEVGDQYLINITNILSNHLHSAATLYRIGGDEFIIISEKEKIDHIEKLIELARKEANSYNINFSYGIAYYDKSSSISEFVQDIDKLMYENKRYNKDHAIE